MRPPRRCPPIRMPMRPRPALTYPGTGIPHLIMTRATRPRDDPDRVALPAPPPAPADPDLPPLAPGVDTTDPAPGDTGANAPARPEQPAHAAPAPDSSAASDRADGDRTAGCPDCTEVEHILLDLGYLNQLLLLLDQIEQNASKLPSALGPVIAHMIRLEHPKLAPLIPATFEADEVKQPLPRADLVALIHAEIGRDATARARAPTPPPVSIGDLRVVYAGPAGSINKPSRASTLTCATSASP